MSPCHQLQPLAGLLPQLGETQAHLQTHGQRARPTKLGHLLLQQWLKPKKQQQQSQVPYYAQPALTKYRLVLRPSLCIVLPPKTDGLRWPQ